MRSPKCAGRKAPGDHGALRKQQQKRERNHKQERGFHRGINDTSGTRLRSNSHCYLLRWTGSARSTGGSPVALPAVCRAGSALWRLESWEPGPKLWLASFHQDATVARSNAAILLRSAPATHQSLLNLSRWLIYGPSNESDHRDLWSYLTWSGRSDEI